MEQLLFTDNQAVRWKLEELAEPSFQKFASSLIPSIPSDKVLGVRLPKLRKIARKIVRTDWRAYLKGASQESFEETMLQGMVIGYAKAELEEILAWIDIFLPKIDNWSVCDSFCSGLKIAKTYRQEIWNYLQQYLRCKEEYKIRFAVVMMIYYYMDRAFICEALNILDGIRHDSYYVKMAVAWAVSMYYLYDTKYTEKYLLNCSLDDLTFHKAIQKVCESKKADGEMKKRIRSLCRK